MIPAEAVEAAAKAYINTRSAEHFTSPQEYAEAMLEAAAPHMLAVAWDQGEAAGQDNADSNRGFDVEHKFNPYRPTP